MSKWLSIFAIAFLVCACGKVDPEGTKSGDCTDGKDNDSDGRVDCADDGCSVFKMCKKDEEPEGSFSGKVKAAAEKSAGNN